MSNRLGRFIERCRIERRLSRSDLVRELDWSNASKGCHRLTQIERGKCFDPDAVEQIANALDIEPEVVDAILDQDYDDYMREWEAWLDQPIRPFVAMRTAPGKWIEYTIPDANADPAVAEDFARTLAVGHQWIPVVLVLSRRQCVWFKPGLAAPTLRLRRQRRSGHHSRGRYTQREQSR